MNIFGITLSSMDLYLLGIAGSLAVIVIGAIIFRKNNFLIRKREKRDKLINETLAPFHDAILNIEHGEHNHVLIMNSFFTAQKKAVSRAKAIATKNKQEDIETAWNNYKIFYEDNAKGQITSQFEVFPDDFETAQKETLRRHLDNLIKMIEKI